NDAALELKAPQRPPNFTPSTPQNTSVYLLSPGRGFRHLKETYDRLNLAQVLLSPPSLLDSKAQLQVLAKCVCSWVPGPPGSFTVPLKQIQFSPDSCAPVQEIH
ncbi:hypothetical protein P7K49_032480, partial [Saguinus oedipus]